MKTFLYILSFLLISSCNHESIDSDQKIFSNEKDTTIWFADKLVLGHDTFDLDMSHHLYKYSDSAVTEWYYRNDTLKPWRDLAGGYLTWQFVNDTIIVGFRAYVPYFLENPKEAGPSYFLIDENHAYLDHLLIKKIGTDPIKLENSKVIIRRLQIDQRTSENILKQFQNDPEKVITW